MPTSLTTANEWIERLGLAPHPEGGWFKEVYRSHERIAQDALPERFDGARSFSTAIYFLLNAGEVSRLHRIQQDEVWHFYDGNPLALHRIRPDGEHIQVQVGRSGDAWPLAVVPAGDYFGAEIAGEGFTSSALRLLVPTTAWWAARLRPGLISPILRCRRGMSYINAFRSTES